MAKGWPPPWVLAMVLQKQALKSEQVESQRRCPTQSVWRPGACRSAAVSHIVGRHGALSTSPSGLGGSRCPYSCCRTWSWQDPWGGYDPCGGVPE